MYTILYLFLFLFLLLLLLYWIQHSLYKPPSPLLESYDKFSRFCGYYQDNEECVSNSSCMWNSIPQHGEDTDYCTLQKKILQEEASA